MLTLDFSKPEGARAYLLTLKALGVPTDRRPSNSVEAASAALAECVAHHTEWLSEFSLAELFHTAERLLILRDEQAGAAVAIYDIAALADAYGSHRMALLAAKLCGAWNDNGKWRDDGTRSEAPVTLSFQS